VLSVLSTRDAPTGAYLWNIRRSIHTGDIYGWPTRILMCLASLALVVQTITGAIMWLGWPRPRNQDGRAASP
jgi:uncharacterized iron-regulated membrane protein